MELPLPEFLSYVYAWLIEGADKEQREKLDALIFTPPKGMKKEKMADLPEWQPEALGADFMATMNRRGQRAN